MTLSVAQEIDFPHDTARRNYERALRTYPAQAIVNLQALRDNMSHLVALVRTQSAARGANPPAVMGVVKADAYGHGLVPVALAALAGGATWLGTAQAREALELRKAGIGPDKAHILTWMYSTPTVCFEDLIEHDIDVSVGSCDAISHIAHAARELGKQARVHVKVDTGFGRNGFTTDQFESALDKLARYSDEGIIAVVGLWSHLSVADSPDNPDHVRATDAQLEAFEDFYARMVRAGLEVQVRHIANTAATLTRPETYYELVRPGIGLYGYEPDSAMGSPQAWGLTPAMTLQAQLGTIKDLPEGYFISYGRTYRTEQDTSTADMPVGYADGIHRSASGFNAVGSLGVEHKGGPVVVMTREGARLVRVSGRVCMDQCVLDLQGNAHELGVSEGDTVVLFGPGRGEEYCEPTADDWARAADTISYEIFTCLRSRIPRLYTGAYATLSQEDRELLDPERIVS